MLSPERSGSALSRSASRLSRASVAEATKENAEEDAGPPTEELNGSMRASIVGLDSVRKALLGMQQRGLVTFTPEVSRQLAQEPGFDFATEHEDLDTYGMPEPLQIAHMRQQIYEYRNKSSEFQFAYSLLLGKLRRKNIIVEYIRTTLYRELVVLREQVSALSGESEEYNKHIFSLFDALKLIEYADDTSFDAPTAAQNAMIRVQEEFAQRITTLERDYQEQLQSKQGQIIGQKRRLEELNNRLQSQQKHYLDEIDKLNRRISDMMPAQDEAEKKNLKTQRELESKIFFLERQSQELRNIITDKESTIAELETSNSNLENVLNDTKKQHTTALAQATYDERETTLRLKALLDEQKLWAREKEDLEAAVQRARKRTADLEALLEESSSKVVVVEDTGAAAQLQREATEQMEKLEELNSKRELLESDLRQLRSSRSLAVAERDDAMKQVEGLQQALREALLEKQDVEQLLQQKTEETISMKASLEKAQQQLDRVPQQRPGSSGDVRHLKVMVETLEYEAKKTREELKSSQAALEEAHRLTEATNEIAKDTKNELVGLQTKYQDLEEEMQTLREAKEHYEKQLAEQQRQFETYLLKATPAESPTRNERPVGELAFKSQVIRREKTIIQSIGRIARLGQTVAQRARQDTTRSPTSPVTPGQATGAAPKPGTSLAIIPEAIHLPWGLSLCGSWSAAHGPHLT
eukprot:TRINITY_DN3207_c0_g1_i4.p1 TRINITY_DN3207_c0_g1~~TRINITY_DN3207_c0_g1_i4.p1  ORF type:complete len:697 (+),score=162.78 TRINITY_DN3207_c0_g1_i4:59-2149(+)